LKKIIVLTDVHILSGGGTIIGIDPAERLRTAVAHINMTSADADLLVITGDLTHWGDPGSYTLLKQLLAPLKMPVRLLIGNHDLRENFLAAFPDNPKDLNGFVQFVEDIGDWRLIGLDSSTSMQALHPDRDTGRLCEKRMAFLERALDKDRKTIVFLHHTPFVTSFPGMDDIMLEKADAFFDVLKQRGNVQLVVSGHIHRTICANVGGILNAVFKSTAHQAPLDFVSKSSSIAVVEPPAYGILLLDESGVVVHSEDYMWPENSGKHYP
jgi:3',5'-cyclic-AMP phosphodiesterase